MSLLLELSHIKIQKGKYGTTTAASLTNPSVLHRVQEFRRSLSNRMTPLDKDYIAKKIPIGEFYVSRKIDGEFTVLVVSEEEIFTINPGGTIRVGFPFFAEALKFLKKAGIKQAMIAGELYVQKPDKSRPRVQDVVRIARKPKSEKEIQQLRFAVFDLMEVNSNPPQSEFEERWKQIQEIFDNTTQIHPVETVKTKDIVAIQNTFLKWVEEEGSEGIVVRNDAVGMFKVKPRHTIDVAVIGFTEGMDERQGMLHDMLVAVMRDEGTFHILGRVGGGFTEEERQTFLSDLKDKIVESDYHEISADHISYQMVRPDWVIEVSCLDLISQNTRGGTVDTMVLNWNSKESKYEIVRPMPLANMTSPQFVRLRGDKTVHPADINLKQITDLVDIFNADKNSLEFSLPKSKLLNREVCTKVLKGALMVRKLVMWKTNKEQESENYPAYVIHYTDFSPNRKNPMDRDIRVSNSKEQIETLWNTMKDKYFVKGWKQVS
ncbi:MAG: hypothetical protein H7A23_21285 [Leptospiraceae bacterium]|nr:ATP-dependent DNA ligase [Leptospiraceae bacterium]MCP5497096.1 hypothetical protein [Leptospiraceae bacterium]